MCRQCSTTSTKRANILLMIEKILQSLDLSADEVKIYLHLLECGQITAGELAKKVGIARPTLYGVLQRLTDHGVVKRSLTHGTRSFSAAPPETLNHLFEQRIENLQTQQKAYQHILPELMSKNGVGGINPRFQMYEGAEGVQHVLKDMLNYQDCETLAFWPIKSMVELLSSDFFRYHNKERIRRNLYTRAIWPQGEVLDIKSNPFLGVGEDFRREIRVAPTNVHFTMGYWMYANKIAFLSSKSESFGFIIESQEMVTMQRAAFEVIWNVSTPLAINPIHTQGFVDEMKQGFRKKKD